jgi:Fur family ferric uptake transcriptional regulator
MHCYNASGLTGEYNLRNFDLKKVGLKVTTPRLKILAILEASGTHHFSAEEIYKLLVADKEDIGLATVYRVLTQFEAAGLVHRHNFEGGMSVFELNSGEHHDHLVCIRCGKIEEFISAEIEDIQQTIAARAGFTITDHDLNIYGICQACQG